DPYGRPGKAGVAETLWTKEVAARAAGFRAQLPPKASRLAHALSVVLCGNLHRDGTQNSGGSAPVQIERRAREAGQVRCGRKEAGVAAHPAARSGVLVVDHAVDHALLHLFGRRDPGKELRAGVEAGVDHPERSENPVLCEPIERAALLPLDERAEEDEAEAAVYDAGIRLACERGAAKSLQHLGRAASLLVEGRPGGQAGC